MISEKICMPKFKDFSNNHNLNDAKNLTWEAAEESLDGFPNLSGGNIAGDVTVNFPWMKISVRDAAT